MGFYQAKEIFDDAKKHLDPKKEPVMWNLLGGLSELAQSLNSLQSQVSRLETEVSAMK